MADEFNNNLNISYTNENLAVPTKELAIKHCLCSYVVYSLIYLILINNPFFQNYFVKELKFFYVIAFTLYVLVSPFIYLIFRPKSLYKSHNIEICDYLFKLIGLIFSKNTILKDSYKVIAEKIRPTYYQKQSIMVMFIKVFFGTLMVKFFYNDIQYIISNKAIIGPIFNNLFANFSFEHFKHVLAVNSDYLYGYAVMLLYTVDVAFFAVGYLTECAFLNNKIRTVDTNIFGVLICIICYPPFNNVTTTFLGWNQNNYAMIHDKNLLILSWAFRIIALCFLVIYASASVALGTRASNLTNRGTVRRFPYNIVRHPAYISKNMFWLLTTIPLLIVNLDFIQDNFVNYLKTLLLVICSVVFWALIYYARAITEERHLMQDPEYQEYAQKVKWRFIPHVF